MIHIIAHAGHPGATGTPLQHGVSHWLYVIPITLIVAVLLLGIVWLLSRKSVQHSKADKE